MSDNTELYCANCGRPRRAGENFAKYDLCPECNAKLRARVTASLAAIKEACDSSDATVTQIDAALAAIDNLEADRDKLPFFKSSTKEYQESLLFKKDRILSRGGVATVVANAPQAAKAPQKQAARGCLVVFLVFITLTSLISSYILFSIKNTSKQENVPRPPSDVAVYVASQFIIEEYLKAPSSAKFPWPDEAEVVKIDDYNYVVSCYVDAQNSFGVPLRSQYAVGLIYNDDWSAYRADTVIIDGEVYK